MLALQSNGVVTLMVDPCCGGNCLAAVTVSGGTTTIDNDSALALRGR